MDYLRLFIINMVARFSAALTYIHKFLIKIAVNTAEDKK